MWSGVGEDAVAGLELMALCSNPLRGGEWSPVFLVCGGYIAASKRDDW